MDRYQLSWLVALQDKYTQALDAAPEAAAERAVYFGNRAACHLKLGQHADAAADCSAALEVQPGYIKVLLRRSTAYEALDELERALMDVQKVGAELGWRGVELYQRSRVRGAPGGSWWRTRLLGVPVLLSVLQAVDAIPTWCLQWLLWVW